MTRIEVILWNLEKYVAEGEDVDCRFDNGFVWLHRSSKIVTGIRQDLIERIEVMEGVS